MNTLSIAGCDCGKDTLHICVLSERPRNLKNYARSYKPLILRPTREDIDKLLALNADIYALEPTGHYSLIWVKSLQRAGKTVRLVSPRRVRHYSEYQGLTNKADTPDAVAIAAYTLDNHADDHAFLRLESLRIRELSLQLASTTRSKNPVQNRLGQRLSFEFPEMLKGYEECDRGWMDANPPAIYRFLAGETIERDNYANKRREKLENTIGEGLSTHTRSLAAQLCSFERMEYELEAQIAAELESIDYARYQPIFDRYLVPPRIRAMLLSRIHPFEDFLINGKANIEYVPGKDSRRKSGMTKRDRSEGEFKLSLGMGKILSQSGSSEKWKAGGAKYARTAIYLYVKLMVVIRRSKDCKDFPKVVSDLERTYRQPGLTPWLNPELIKATAEVSNCSEEMAILRLHYEFQVDKKGDRRVSATGGKFCRMLYKSLLKEFAHKQD